MEAVEAAASVEPELLDHSELILGHRIGGGAEGQVHFGFYKSEPVAIKIFTLPEGIKVEDRPRAAILYKDLFDVEVNLLCETQHQNVLKFVAAGRKPSVSATESPVFYLVTEYVSQGSLCAFLKKSENNHLPLDKIVAAALDIARGMESIHAKKVVHRDLKPDNILVDKDHRMKIADFGSACTEEYCKIAKDGGGTYLYMAPEMIREETYGKKVDVFSFGVILWQLFSGSMPFRGLFKGMTDDQVAKAVGSKNKRPAIPRRCPLAMKALIEQCWSSDPNKRPEFSQVVKVLEEFQSSLGRHPIICSSSQDNKGRLLHWIHKIAGPCTHPPEHNQLHHHTLLGCLV